MQRSFVFPELHPLDLGIIVLYLIANLALGFVAIRKRRNKISDAEEYLLAGRTLTLPAFVATLVSTWYGGIVAVGEYAYDNGLVTWVVFGIPYYFAAIIFALVLAKRINSDRTDASIADRLRSTYGPTSGYIGAVATFFLTSPASYIIMLATLYEWFFGLPFEWGVAVAIVTSIGYLFSGGFRASIRADMLQFTMMFVGFAIILPFAFSELGSIGNLASELPDSHTRPFGGFSLGYVLVWYIAAMTTLVDPNVHARAFAAKTPEVARNGMLVSVGFWLLFDFLTTTTGLYARMAIPDLAQSKFAYPALAELLLPIGFKGLFYVGMLSTVLSTADSFFFTSASIFGRDILWRMSGKDQDYVRRYIRIGLFITAAVSLPIILYAERIYNVWYSMGSVLVPTLLLPLAISFLWKDRVRAPAINSAMVASGLVSLAWYIVGQTTMGEGAPDYWFGIEPMYAGLIVSVLILVPSCIRSIGR